MRAFEKRAKRINISLKVWFKETGKAETDPEEIMPYLIEKGIYKDSKIALQLRNDLRKLNKNNKLYLIEGAGYDQKKVYKRWYFKKI